MSFENLTRKEISDRTPKFEPSDDAKRRASDIIRHVSTQNLAQITDPSARVEAEERHTIMRTQAERILVEDKINQKLDYTIEQNIVILDKVEKTNGSVGQAHDRLNVLEERNRGYDHDKEIKRAQEEAVQNYKTQLEALQHQKIERAVGVVRFLKWTAGPTLLAVVIYVWHATQHQIVQDLGTTVREQQSSTTTTTIPNPPAK